MLSCHLAPAQHLGSRPAGTTAGQQCWRPAYLSENKGDEDGAPVGIRTPNLLIRSQVLYPVELRVRKELRERDSRATTEPGQAADVPQDPKTAGPELFSHLHFQRPAQERPLVGDLLDLHPGRFAGTVTGAGLHPDEQRVLATLIVL